VAHLEAAPADILALTAFSTGLAGLTSSAPSSPINTTNRPKPADTSDPISSPLPSGHLIAHLRGCGTRPQRRHRLTA
jgi:hypothetical protein